MASVSGYKSVFACEEHIGEIVKWLCAFLSQSIKQERRLIFFRQQNMITKQDLYNIVGKKISNEMSKTIIRNNMPPKIAEQICKAIDANEKAEHFQRLIRELMEYQQAQQMIFQSFLQQYYG